MELMYKTDKNDYLHDFCTSALSLLPSSFVVFSLLAPGFFLLLLLLLLLSFFLFLAKTLVYYCFLVFFRIGEYISLYLFCLSVSPTSCSLIPWMNHLRPEGQCAFTEQQVDVECW